MERWVSKVSGIIAPMSLCACLSALARAAGRQIPCRGCLAPLGEGAEAGLCRACWEGLVPLPALRCPRCALPHGADRDCPEPVAWSLGDALWDYHGGRPPLGALLVPAIKAGELAWMQALHRRMAEAPLPSWAAEADCATCVPTPLPRRLLRGFDLAEDTARLLARRLDLSFAHTLGRPWRTGRQMARTESERRRLPRHTVHPLPGVSLEGRVVLLVDDVWTTGTTLLRCAQALQAAGARELRVLTLFRALQGHPVESSIASGGVPR